MTPEEIAVFANLKGMDRAFIQSVIREVSYTIHEAEERVRRETIEACARIADEYDAGHEFDQYEIADAIRSCPDSTAGTS